MAASPQSPSRLRFDSFEVDLRSGDLRSAAQVYGKLWHYRQFNLDYALSAAGLYAALGDSSQAARYVDELTKHGQGESVRRELPNLISTAHDFERKAGQSAAPAR